MLILERIGDVTRLHMSSRRSRAVGYSVSAYLVRGTLVDTGFHDARHELARLLDETRPVGALITHHHEDHAGNVPLLVRRGVPIAIPAATEAVLRSPEPIGVYRRFAWGTPERLVSDIIPHEPAGLELLAAPGHSSDHHVVWDPTREILFGGDLWIGVKVRIARPGENPREHVRQLRRFAALRPRTLFDAHRGAVERPHDVLVAKADWMEDLIGRVDARRAAGASVSAITRELLGREDAICWFSAGDWCKRNLVASIVASGESAAVGR